MTAMPDIMQCFAGKPSLRPCPCPDSQTHPNAQDIAVRHMDSGVPPGLLYEASTGPQSFRLIEKGM